jgi:hypothetical protein
VLLHTSVGDVNIWERVATVPKEFSPMVADAAHLQDRTVASAG